MEWTSVHNLPKSNYLCIHILELKQIEYSWLCPHSDLSSSSLGKVGILGFGWGTHAKSQHVDSSGQCAFIHYTSTLFPPTYDMRWLIDGKFRGVAAKVDDFASVWMFRGGRRQIWRGADSKFQYWYWTTINYNKCMGRALNNGPWYTRSATMLMEGPLYRCRK